MLAGIALALILVYGWFDPARFVLFPKCLFHTLTGWDCPGCGSQRALHALLHGRIGEAFSHNQLLILAVPYLGTASYLEYFNGKIRFPRLRKTLMGRQACIVIFGVVLLFWAARNFF